jgi:hypothetical protein
MPRISRRAGVALVCAGALACAVVGMLLGVLAAGGHHQHALPTRPVAVSPATSQPAPPTSVVTVVSTAAAPPPKPKPKHPPQAGDQGPGHGHHHHHPHAGDGNDQGGG